MSTRRGDSLDINFTWNLSPKQRQLFESDARFRVGMMGRRFGKNEVGSAVAIDYATRPESYSFGSNSNPIVWWVGPTYRQAYLYGFLKVKEKLPDVLIDTDNTRGSEWGPSRITLSNGPEIEFLSYGNPSGLQGAGVDLIVGDEWAYSDESLWHNDLRPMLMDSGGGAVLISKPLGENHFYEFYQQGEATAKCTDCGPITEQVERHREQHADEESPPTVSADPYPEWAGFHATAYENPFIPDGEVDKAKKTTPEGVFRQEYLADPQAGGTLLTLDMLEYNPYTVLTNEDGPGFKYHVAVDIGVTMKKKKARENNTDYWAAAVVAEHPFKPKVWLLQVLRERGQTPAQAAEWLSTVMAQVPTDRAYVEDVQAQRWFQEDARDVGITPIPIEHSRPKEERITFLSVPFSNGNVKLIDWSEHPDHSFDWSEFRTEWAGFPNASHDDQLDATEMALRHVDFGDAVQMYGADPYDSSEDGGGDSWQGMRRKR